MTAAAEFFARPFFEILQPCTGLSALLAVGGE